PAGPPGRGREAAHRGRTRAAVVPHVPSRRSHRPLPPAADGMGLRRDRHHPRRRPPDRRDPRCPRRRRLPSRLPRDRSRPRLPLRAPGGAGMSRDLAVRLALGLGPLLLGLAASLVWLAAGGGAPVYVLGRLTWMPLLFGVAATAVLAPALLAAHRERRRAERARRHALEQLAARHRRVLSRLDHELKNPIQGIRVALADEPSDRQRASIDAQSQRLTGLLRDLRRLGEVEETALELAP